MNSDPKRKTNDPKTWSVSKLSEFLSFSDRVPQVEIKRRLKSYEQLLEDLKALIPLCAEIAEAIARAEETTE